MPKIVIDIPEEKYKEISNNNPQYSDDFDLYYAIKNGIPLDDIKAEILEETECPYGDKCLGANCPSNTDCMIMGEHAIWIIDKHTGKEQSE